MPGPPRRRAIRMRSPDPYFGELGWFHLPERLEPGQAQPHPAVRVARREHGEVSVLEVQNDRDRHRREAGQALLAHMPGFQPQALGGAQQVVAVGRTMSEPEVVGELRRLSGNAIIAGDECQRLKARVELLRLRGLRPGCGILRFVQGPVFSLNPMRS